MLGWLGTRSIATRLFLSAAFWSVLILLLAGVTLATINRRSAESDFDERLSVYLRALAADVADPGEDARSNLGQLGEPMFELPLSGWYWQITPLDGDANDIRASRSLFAERLPKLQDSGVQAGVGGTRKGYAIGPDDRRLRIVERVIDTGDKHHYLVQVAASPEEVEADIRSFNVALGLTCAILALRPDPVDQRCRCGSACGRCAASAPASPPSGAATRNGSRAASRATSPRSPTSSTC